MRSDPGGPKTQVFLPTGKEAVGVVVTFNQVDDNWEMKDHLLSRLLH